MLLDNRLRRYGWWRRLRGLPEPKALPFADLMHEMVEILSRRDEAFSQILKKEYDRQSGPLTIQIKRPARYTYREPKP